MAYTCRCRQREATPAPRAVHVGSRTQKTIKKPHSGKGSHRRKPSRGSSDKRSSRKTKPGRCVGINEKTLPRAPKGECIRHVVDAAFRALVTSSLSTPAPPFPASPPFKPLKPLKPLKPHLEVEGCFDPPPSGQCRHSGNSEEGGRP